MNLGYVLEEELDKLEYLEKALFILHEAIEPKPNQGTGPINHEIVQNQLYYLSELASEIYNGILRKG